MIFSKMDIGTGRLCVTLSSGLENAEILNNWIKMPAPLHEIIAYFTIRHKYYRTYSTVIHLEP